MGRSAGDLQPLGVALARPHPHPLRPPLTPADPPHRLGALRRRALPVAVVPADHPKTLPGLGPNGVGVIGGHWLEAIRAVIQTVPGALIRCNSRRGATKGQRALDRSRNCSELGFWVTKL